MQIKQEKSSTDALRNRGNRTLDVGGYCWLHDARYRVMQGDETCPRCDKWQAQDLGWRDEEDAHFSNGDDLGDFDE